MSTWQRIERGNVEKTATGGLNITLNLDGPKDEGDFGTVEMMIGLLGAADGLEPEEGEKPKTAEENFVSKLGSVIALLDDDKMKQNFVKKNYIAFLSELKKAGHQESFAYLIMSQLGN
jgi:hypothetical protein